MTVRIFDGDLLRQEADAIVNTVNCVGIMGKGIALQFKRKWPQNFTAYEKACKLGQIEPGKMFVFDLGGLYNKKPEFIINFPTKKHWRGNSKLEYIQSGLEDLVKVIKKLEIRSIAIPPLGCGNGGLDWQEVYPLIQNALSSLDVDARVFAPNGAPDPQTMVTMTERPKMTLGRAILVKLISIYGAVYKDFEYSLSAIEIQKLCYFSKEAGEKAFEKLLYEKNQYGPYASNLRHVLDHMEGHFIQGVGDNDKAPSQIKLVDGAEKEADAYLNDHPDAIERINNVALLIQGFETPFGMELLSTVHWVALKDRAAKSAAEAVDAVYGWKFDQPEWNERKKSMMKPAHIEIAWNRLKDQRVIL